MTTTRRGVPCAFITFTVNDVVAPYRKLYKGDIVEHVYVRNIANKDSRIDTYRLYVSVLTSTTQVILKFDNYLLFIHDTYGMCMQASPRK